MATRACYKVRSDPSSLREVVIRNDVTKHIVYIGDHHEFSDVLRWVESSEAKGRFRLSHGTPTFFGFSDPDTAFICKMKFG